MKVTKAKPRTIAEAIAEKETMIKAKLESIAEGIEKDKL